MTRNKQESNKKQNDYNSSSKNFPEHNQKIDHLLTYVTENPTETNKLWKLHTHIENKVWTVILKNKKKDEFIAHLQQRNENGSQILEFVLPIVEQKANILNIKQIAISLTDDVFKHIPLNSFKTVVNNISKSMQIIIYRPPKFLNDLQEIQRTLVNYHNTPTGGHIGQHRLYLKLREKYTWKDMKGSISRFVQACESCKKNKIMRHTKEKMVLTTTPSTPFEIISIDTVGPLPRSNNNNRYAISIQCDLTKYVVLIPVPTKEANIIAKALVNDFLLTYGTFLVLRSDQGLEYNNEIFKQIGKLLQIEQKFSTAYHPQTIGSLERNHRCLNEYLRSFVNEHQSDWDEWLKYYAFNYNTTSHSDHGFTPYELVFGKKAALPQDIFEKGIEPVYNFEQYNTELKYKLQKSNEIAKNKLTEQKLRRTTTPENNINPIDLNLNERVYLKIENRRKLDPFYDGPYLVEEILHPNCKIRNTRTNQSSIV